MSDKSHATIHLTAGTVTTDWCNTCLLPSVVVVPFHTIGPSGVSHVATYARCQECSSTTHNPEGDPVSAPNPPAEGRNGRWEKLGEVGVDSASIAITCADPNARYAKPGSRWAGDWGTGIRFTAGFGDGGYDVWAWIADYGEDGEVDERIAQVVLTLIDDSELEAWRQG